MPAGRGVKRTASKASAASTAAAGPKIKKKRNVVQLEVPTLPKRRGRVLTCGQGDVGQLGLGEDVIETTKFKHVTGLAENIVDVVAGGMHTVALDCHGKIWTFGCNDEGALGRPTSGDTDEGTPKAVTLPLPAVLVTAGDSHTAALLNNGDVYAWGSFRDSHGSMGLVVSGREGKPCREPVRLHVPEPAAGLASGSDHLAVLTTGGAVYTLGCGEQGQLGRLAQRSASRDTRQGFSALLIPSKVTLKQGASAVWAGYHATFATDAANERMFAWGLNNYGQLGIPGENRKVALYSPTECSSFAAPGVSWKAVAAGQHHSLALDASGKVYSVGRVEYGRLGLGERSGDAEKLELVPKLQNKRVVSIAAGTSNSFAVTDTGEVFGWGMGSEGQLGTGGSADCNEPTLSVCMGAAQRTPTAVGAGGQHSVILAVDPNAPIQAEPEPEQETAGEIAAEEEEPQPPPEKKATKGRPTKRSRKHEQEDEVSSTSTAPPPKVNGDEKKETAMDVDETDNKQETKEESDKMDTNDATKTDNTNATKLNTDEKTEDVEMTEAKPKPEEKQPESEPPKPESVAPKPESVPPKTEPVAPKTESVPSKPESVPPKSESVPPKPESVPPKSESVPPKPESVPPKSEAPKPESEAPKPEPQANSDPKPEAKAEMNGTPEESKIGTKTVESLNPEPITTSA